VTVPHEEKKDHEYIKQLQDSSFTAIFSGFEDDGEWNKMLEKPR